MKTRKKSQSRCNAVRTGTIVAVILCLSIAIGPKPFAVSSSELIEISSLAKLYSGVEFDHFSHQENYECGSCHHDSLALEDKTECLHCHDKSTDTEPASCRKCHLFRRTSQNQDVGQRKYSYHKDIPGLKAAYHLQCLGCHKRDEGPVDCTVCHEYSELGEKFYAIADD